MPRYVVLSKFTPAARKTLHAEPELYELQFNIEALGGKVIEQHMVFGVHDVFTVVDLPDTECVQGLALGERATRTILPAIDLDLFARLIGQSAETTGPHRWQASWPCRVACRALSPSMHNKTIKSVFDPLTVRGAQHLEDLGGPAVFVANHTSHLDGTAMYAALPKDRRRSLAMAVAADRFYIKGRKGWKKQGWWFSLAWNMFPIKRSGGRAGLEHAEWLIDRGMSIGIFPEGGRSSGHKLGRFRVGPVLLAITKQIPIVPMYFDGLRAIRPKGSQTETPGPVTVCVGAPISLPPGSDPFVATMALQKTVEELGRQWRAERPAPAVTGLGPAQVAPLNVA